jgi:predicted Zn-dependent protease
LQLTTYSFRSLSAAEAAKLRPQSIRVVAVRSGGTVASLAKRMAFADHQEERFRVLNGLEPGEPLAAGQRVKIIVE